MLICYNCVQIKQWQNNYIWKKAIPEHILKAGAAIVVYLFIYLLQFDGIQTNKQNKRKIGKP